MNVLDLIQEFLKIRNVLRKEILEELNHLLKVVKFIVLILIVKLLNQFLDLIIVTIRNIKI